MGIISMKNINKYINERLHITTKSFYIYKPKTRRELKEIIIERIQDEGPECDLNDIDVSKIKSMGGLFNAHRYYNGNEIFKDFNGDISQWNVSNVTNMSMMFLGCEKFNCDISGWNVSNVKDMNHMFYHCKQFNGDLSRWNVSKVENMGLMFYWCEQFNCDLSQWDVSNVTNMNQMFWNCKKFDCDINQWDVRNVIDKFWMFDKCPTKPKWYKWK